MRILIATTHVPFVNGGAEIQAKSLQNALIKHGHEVDIAAIPFKWYPPEKIHEHLLATRLLDLKDSNGVPIDQVIGLKFPAYHIQHPNKVTWVVHQHRTAFEMWQSEHCDISPYPDGKAVRDSIEKIERRLLPEAKALFCECRNVGDRLKKYCDIDATPLYHPPMDADTFFSQPPEDFLYFPSRLNRWKRQHLAIEALAKTTQPVNLVFSGAPDVEAYEKSLISLAEKLKLTKRIKFLGKIPFNEMQSLYSRCRAVLFPPDNEDYGYITLEAMLSHKPVITCTDSGGPVEFIRHEQEGLIADPTPESLAKAMDQFWLSNSMSESLGKNSFARYNELDITWDNVVKKLVQ